MKIFHTLNDLMPGDKGYRYGIDEKFLLWLFKSPDKPSTRANWLVLTAWFVIRELVGVFLFFRVYTLSMEAFKMAGYIQGISL